MGKETGDARTAGVTINGTVGSVGGDIVGRDKISSFPSGGALDEALRPLFAAVGTASERAEAEAKLNALKQEAAKGPNAEDGVIAKLVDGLVGLVPGAARAVAGAFATPILGDLAGPVTRFVLDKLPGAESEVS